MTIALATARPRAVLGRRASLWVSAGVVAHTLWTSAAPAMVYRSYAEQWHLSQAATTAIFAVYPVAVVATLIGFGDVSDHVGRRSTMLAGLAASLAGAILFALATNVLWLFAARALMGMGVGLTAGPSTAAATEFSKAGASRGAARFTTVAQAGGFAASLLLGGALVQYAPWPTRLVFWVLAALLMPLLAATWFLPRGETSGGRWRSRVPVVPKGMRRAFVLASAAMATAYTHGVLVLSLGGQVAHDLVGSPNALVNGAVLSLFAVASAAVGLAAGPLAGRLAIILGALASAASMGLLAAAVALHLLPVFLSAMVLAGAGYSLLFLGSLQMIIAAAPAQDRGGVLSAVYLLAYLAMGGVALALGMVATARGLGFSVCLGAGVVASLSLAALLLASSSERIAP